jgi:multidrug efflux pump subunit AcrB
MLVDNAIVVVDGTLVRIQKGMKPEQAASEVVQQTTLPLLGATAVAIMAFGAIGLSDDSTGEFCRSLFQVVLIALGLSWITAVSVTPVLCVMFLKPNQTQDGVDNEDQRDPYGGALYTAYRGLLGFCIRTTRRDPSSPLISGCPRARTSTKPWLLPARSRSTCSILRR